MPAKKPSGLIKKHEVKAARKARTDGEAALKPRVELTLKAPVRLKGQKDASARWKQMVTLYRGLEAEIISRMDQDMLVDYCILDVQVVEMDKLRTAAIKNYSIAQKALEAMGKRKDIDAKVLFKFQDSVNWAMGEITKLDARVDRKRALLHTLRQSLYLTPRSRAQFVPKEKEPEQPKTEMDKLLDES